MASIFSLGTHLTHDTSVSFTPRSSRPHYIFLSERQSDCVAIVHPPLPFHFLPTRACKNFWAALAQKNAPAVLKKKQKKENSVSVCDPANKRCPARKRQKEIRKTDGKGKKENLKPKMPPAPPLTTPPKDFQAML